MAVPVLQTARSGSLDRSWLSTLPRRKQVLRLASRTQLGASHADSIRSERQREADPRLRRSVRAARSCAAPGSVETSIEPLTPVAASVDRLREVDHLSQALGDV
jgi:hypothetical protein